jgi:hypothetical protein
MYSCVREAPGSIHIFTALYMCTESMIHIAGTEKAGAAAGLPTVIIKVHHSYPKYVQANAGTLRFNGRRPYLSKCLSTHYS